MALHQHRYYLAAILVLSLLAYDIGAQVDDDNKILYPDVANLTFHLFDTIDVAITTNYSTPWLYLFCWDSTGLRQEIVYYSPSDVTNKETVPVKLQSHTQYTGTTCWFNLLPDSESGDDDVGVESPEFSYVKEAAGNTTFGLSTTTTTSAKTSSTQSSSLTDSTKSSSLTESTTTPTVTSSTTGATGSSSTAADLSESSSQSGLSKGASAGVGVVAGLLGVAIGAAVVWLFLRRQKRDSTLNDTPHELAGPGDQHHFELPEDRQHHELPEKDKYWQQTSGQPPVELDTHAYHDVAHELPAHQYGGVRE